MATDTVRKNLGPVSAYAYAKAKGYTGTEEEFAELMASYADVAEQAGDSAEAAAASAALADQHATTAANAAVQAHTEAGTAATQAGIAANQATSAASSAQAAATEADRAADKAGEAAQSASDLVDAVVAATAAKDAAETAQGLAEDAQTAAETARTGAQTAKTGAETAQAAAEAAQAAAESVEASIPADYSQLNADVTDLKSQISLATEDEYFYNPSVSWEKGSLGNNGQPIESGNYRQRTTEFIQILYGRKILFYIPRFSYIWVYQYDSAKNYMPGLVSDWLGATSGNENGMIELTPNAKTAYIKMVIRTLNKYGGYEASVQDGASSSNTHVMQYIGNRKDDKYTNIPFYVGGMQDYRNLTIANNRERANTNILPVNGRHAFYSIPSGYQAYIWELNDNFEYVNERGWASGLWYYYLSEETAYIRLVIKADDGTTAPDMAYLQDNTAVEFKKNIEKILVNPTMLDNLLLAHRGYAVTAPENTLPALELAHQNGYKMVEIDLQFTSDGVCVLLHDNTINRTSNGTGNIYDMTYEQALQYDFGSWKSAEYAGTKIPTLKEALLLCKYYGMCVQLDVADINKTNITDENLQTMLDDINACGMIGNVNICCYESRARKLVSMQNGIVVTLGIGNSVANAQKISDISKACSLMIGSNNTTIQSDEMIEYCHSNGLLYQIWTINTVITADDNFKKGVDWIITDSLKPSDLPT